jgi:hypothetical protein
VVIEGGRLSIFEQGSRKSAFPGGYGVALTLVPEIPGNKVGGAARRPTSNKAMIAINLRVKRNDKSQTRRTVNIHIAGRRDDPHPISGLIV